MTELRPVDRQLQPLLAAFAFGGPTCRPSQALLAEILGVTRETVNRSAGRLRDAGEISWTRARRPGSRWEHNVYTLTHWNPPLRKHVLKMLDKIRGRRFKRFRGKVTLNELQRAKKDQRTFRTTTAVGSTGLKVTETLGLETKKPPDRVQNWDGVDHAEADWECWRQEHAVVCDV